MTGKTNLPQRRTLRLQDFDYSIATGYFITINVMNKTPILGSIQDSVMVENDAGRFVWQTWQSLEKRFPTIMLDEFVVMPNHVHGVLFLGARQLEDAAMVREAGRASPAPTRGEDSKLGAVIGAFKSISAIGCNRILGTQGQPFWQRNYYEHIIRDDASLERIREYIAGNPANWAQDEENPDRR